jgi:hypothetical protein
MKPRIGFALLALIFGLCGARSIAAQDLAITNVRIIVGNGEVNGNPLEGYWNMLNAKVVIKGGVIVSDKR